MLEKIEGRRRRGQQRMRWLDAITGSMDVSFEQTPGDCEGQGNLVCAVHGAAKSQTQLSDQATATIAGFRSQLVYSLAVWPGASNFTSLSLCFFIYKVDIVRIK